MRGHGGRGARGSENENDLLRGTNGVLLLMMTCMLMMTTTITLLVPNFQREIDFEGVLQRKGKGRGRRSVQWLHLSERAHADYVDVGNGIHAQTVT